MAPSSALLLESPSAPLVFFGQRKPVLQVTVGEEGRRRRVTATNAYSIWAEDIDAEGSLNIGRLLEVLGTRESAGCHQCKEHLGFCPLVTDQARRWEEVAFPDEAGVPEAEFLQNVAAGREHPQWQACLAWAKLADVCQTDAERVLLSSWAHFIATQEWIRVPNRCKVGHLWSYDDQDFPHDEEDLDRVARDEIWQASCHLLRELASPALIPQAWVRIVQDPEHKTSPQRVDFMAFWRGQVFVVEVDDSGHFAISTGAASQRTYIERTLETTRTLEEMGLRVHRLANAELIGERAQPHKIVRRLRTWMERKGGCRNPREAEPPLVADASGQ